jgi:hypothetical protein
MAADNYINEISVQRRQEFKELKNKHNTTEKEFILKFAKELEQHGMNKRDICSHIKKVVDGIVTPQWVGEVLPAEYKDLKKRNTNAIANKPKEKEPEQSRAEKALLTVGTDGKQRTEREKPITDRPEFKALSNQLASVTNEKNILEKRNSLIQKMQAEGLNLDVDKTPEYFKGNATVIRTHLTRFMNGLKDRDPKSIYFVSILKAVPQEILKDGKRTST